MKAKESRYFSWLLKSKSMQFQIEQWLVDNDFDVYSGHKIFKISY